MLRNNFCRYNINTISFQFGQYTNSYIVVDNCYNSFQGERVQGESIEKGFTSMTGLQSHISLLELGIMGLISEGDLGKGTVQQGSGAYEVLSLDVKTDPSISWSIS